MNEEGVVQNHEVVIQYAKSVALESDKTASLQLMPKGLLVMYGRAKRESVFAVKTLMGKLEAVFSFKDSDDWQKLGQSENVSKVM